MAKTLHVDVKMPDPVMTVEIMVDDDDDDDGVVDVAVSNEEIEGGQVIKLEIKNAIKDI